MSSTSVDSCSTPNFKRRSSKQVGEGKRKKKLMQTGEEAGKRRPGRAASVLRIEDFKRKSSKQVEEGKRRKKLMQTGDEARKSQPGCSASVLRIEERIANLPMQPELPQQEKLTCKKKRENVEQEFEFTFTIGIKHHHQAILEAGWTNITNQHNLRVADWMTTHLENGESFSAAKHQSTEMIQEAKTESLVVDKPTLVTVKLPISELQDNNDVKIEILARLIKDEVTKLEADQPQEVDTCCRGDDADIYFHCRSNDGATTAAKFDTYVRRDDADVDCKSNDDATTAAQEFRTPNLKHGTAVAGSSQTTICRAARKVTAFMKKLDQKSTVKISDFKPLAEEMKRSNGDCVPAYLDYVAKGLNRKIIREDNTFSKHMIVRPLALFYAEIDEMRKFRLQDINEDVMLKWGFVINDALGMGMDVSFAMEHLKRIAHAYFSLNAPKRGCQALETLNNEFSSLEAAFDKLDLLHKKSEELDVEMCGICKCEAESFDGYTLSKGILMASSLPCKVEILEEVHISDLEQLNKCKPLKDS